ncbi:MAG: nucleotidyltransferase domain-containing protein [Polyangiales bacterium]
MSVLPAELAATLVARRRARAALDRERAHVARRALGEAAVALRAEGACTAAWLIGSLAWGGFGERSDADVVLAGADDGQPGALAARLSGCADVTIDLSFLEQLPDSFRRRVLAEGVRLDEP